MKTHLPRAWAGGAPPFGGAHGRPGCRGRSGGKGGALLDAGGGLQKRFGRRWRTLGDSPAGASLIEVLVALFVVATGALGLAGLQLASAQHNRAAAHRTLAVLLAGDMLERMRVNPGVRYPDVGLGPPGGVVDCVARPCTPAELAAFDVAVWKCSLGRWNDEAPCVAARAIGVLPPLARQPGLPRGDGSISRGPAGATVTVAWQGIGAGQVVLGGAP